MNGAQRPCHTLMANTLKLSAVGLLALLAAGTFAQTASTTPVGFMRYTIAAGTPAAPVTTAIAIPLHDVGGVAGVSTGVISAVSPTTVSVNSAGWTAAALSTASIPYALCIKSGAAEGSMLKISANTDTVLTLETTDLVALGVVAGDRFEIIPVDTLLTFFGTDTLLGGTAASSADIVYLMNGGSWTGYYYNTSLGRWVTKTGATMTRNNVILQPGSGILVERRAAALDIVATGTVPSMKYRVSVANSGSTFVHTGFPTDVTLSALTLQSLVPGWVSNAAVQSADWLYVLQGGIWVSYYHNGTWWRLTSGPNSTKNGVIIAAGTPILLLKKGTAAGTSSLQRALPYSL